MVSNLLLLSSLLLVAPVSLEWNSHNRTDVAYEATVNLNKLGDSSARLQAFADGKGLPTIYLHDKDFAEQKIRFIVPSETKELILKPGEVSVEESDRVDNILSAGEWKEIKKLAVSNTPQGVLLESKEWGISTAEYFAEVPKGCAGKPAAFELDCRSISKMAWNAVIGMNQYDAEGNLLPEKVYDSRWTTHARPAGKFTPFRESGYIHPKAVKVGLKFTFIADEPKFDNYGLPIKNVEDARPRLLVSRMTLRPAASAIFPKYDDSFFGKGVSGEDDDCSLVLDGDRAWGYSTRSIAAWSGNEQIRKEEELFYPSADGTVELWIKPSSWAKVKNEQVLFEAAQFYNAHHNSIRDKSKSPVFTVAYTPESKTLRLYLADINRQEFQKSAVCELPEGVWKHLAATFVPGKEACLFVDGKKILSFPLEGYVPLDFKSKYPNDQHAVLFVVGGSLYEVKTLEEKDRLFTGLKYFIGEVDALRASTGVRYTADFIPEKRFSTDEDSRAIFDFDRSFDGVSGGGIGWISGILSCPQDRQMHKVGDIQYYPEKLEGENDPGNILFPRVKEICTEQDFKASEVKTVLSRKMHPGETVSIDAPEGAIPDYVEIRNSGKDVLLYPALLRDGDIDARSYGDIAESLDIPGATDREKVNRFFNFFLVESDYFANYQLSFPIGSDSFTNVSANPLENMNGYCGFECGPLNTIASTMYATAAGCPANLTWGYGHLFQEVFFDGMNHTYDLSAQRFFPAMNLETAAGLREIEEQTYCIRRFGTSAGHFTRAGSRVASFKQVDFPEKFAISLNPGESVRFWKMNDGKMNNLVFFPWWHKANAGGIDLTEEVHAAAPKDEHEKVFRRERIFPEFGSGFLRFNGKPSKENPAFCNIEKNSFCYDVKVFYTIVAAQYKAILAGGKEAALEISTDGGKTFREFKSPATYAVRARRGYLIRVCAPIEKVKSFEATTEFQVNSRIVNGLVMGGSNNIRLKAEGGSEAQVSWQYRTQSSPITFEGARMFGSIKGQEKSLVVLSDKKMTVGVKGVSAKAEAVAGEFLSAKLSGGKLSISSMTDEPHISWVTVKDGEREKTLSVIICKNARICNAGTEFTKAGEKEEYKFDRIPAGKYTLIPLMRMPVDLKFFWSSVMYVKFGTAKGYRGYAAVNPDFDYRKDVMGPDGGKGVWRWCGASSKGKEFPKLLYVETEETDKVSASFIGKEGTLELDCFLILPESGMDFKVEIVNALFGRNNRPWAVK